MEKLLVLLHELDQRLSYPAESRDKESNMAEQFCWFIENSSSGDNCQYAQKCLRVFKKRDYEDIKKLIYDVVKSIEEIEKS